MTQPRETQVCIAGGGPAGMVLGYLLGRCGIATLVLESQPDFDRDFRGDTVHAGVMEIFDALGLAEGILNLPHHKIRRLAAGGVDLIDFRRLKTKFPFVTMMAQATLLDFLAKESSAFPSYQLEMNANARELIREASGRVVGLRYRQDGEMTEVRAALTVACDGRGSHLRKEAGLAMKTVTDPLEVLWFRLPRLPSDDAHERSGLLVGGRLPLFLLARPEHYQIACVIPPGHFAEIRGEGLAAFHQRIGEAAPDLFDRAEETLDDWKKLAFLHVQGGRLDTWHQPGLLLIGDAAHTMTPVGGVGINYAIWDAVETANVIAPILRRGERIDDSHLAEIQRRREFWTKVMQTIQRVAGRRVLNAVARDDKRRFRAPLLLRLLLATPGIRALAPRLVALGGKRTRCEVFVKREA